MKLEALFDVERGNHLDLNDLNLDATGTNYVSCTGTNNGVLARVERLPDIAPASPGTLSLALVGATCSAFLQKEPYYRAQNVVTLVPKRPMKDSEKLWWAYCIRQHAWRFNYGRKANRTFKELELPNAVPSWVKDDLIPDYSHLAAPAGPAFRLAPIGGWEVFRLDELFDVKKGVRKINRELTPGTTPYVRATDKRNGVVGYHDLPLAHPAGTISVSYNGSVGEAFYQPNGYFASDDVNVLYPLGFELTAARGLFVAALIRREKYRYNYGRKWRMELMKKTTIRLPAIAGGLPDWEAIDQFVASLPWSATVCPTEKSQALAA